MGILRTDKISGLETPTAVTGSVYFDGTGDYLAVTPINNSFVNWWQSDFTIEAWIYADSYADWWFNDVGAGNDIPAMVGHFEHDGSTNYWSFGPVSDNTVKFYYWKGSQNHTFVTSDKVVVGEWSHIAMTYSVANGAKLFINGRGTDYISLSGTPQADISAAEFNVGQYNSESITGYVSNLRILNGTALYTSNFTPPVHELQLIGDTALLCCNNPDSAGAEATGKTITVNGDAAASTFSPGLTRDFTYGTEFKGVTTFDTQGYFVPPSGTTEQRGRGRGFFVGGNNPTYFSNIDTVQISSQGNAIRFGDLSVARAQTYGAANSTRGIVFGSYDGSSNGNFLEAFDTTTGADAIDFGNLLSSTARRGVLGMASNTRAIAAGGSTPSRDNTIQYVTIASLGDAQEFGDLIADSSHASAATACSPTRGVMGGGTKLVSGSTNSIGYITMATTGNSVDFGDALSTATGPSGVVSSSTRGVFFHSTPTAIEFITISSLGNAQEFGDLGTGIGGAAAVTNSVRGLNAGAYISPANVNTITFVNIASTGDGTDFGDLIKIISSVGGYSDSHGGIS